MMDKNIAKFTLCRSLIELLGEEEAIADLYRLYHRHPEMFDSENELKAIIEQVVNEPDLITKNPKPKNDKDFMAYKQLNARKIADVGIRNDNGKNVIFHANKKNIDKFSEDIRKQMSVEASSANAAPTRLDHYADKSNDLSRCNKALSTPDGDIIQQNNLECQESNQTTHKRSK